ncbi:hypothetical protein PoB_000384900 [Plakobranchus ocellatus]|uniref:Uncharacterized protein n=1 Tax=Plakobranchus ocellatus TaxID=259542 RepID=A0AAV3Y547_9GAST|nr:hypothetical protein PoB_000384900 [Plakobranchus ocellatus]
MRDSTVWFGLVYVYIANPQQGDLRLSGPTSGQSVGGGTRTQVRRVLPDLRTDSLVSVPPTPPAGVRMIFSFNPTDTFSLLLKGYCLSETPERKYE